MRTFKETPVFHRKWRKLGLSDEDLLVLENLLIDFPKFGDVIQGTNGARKIRIPMERRGKRGGGRVIYVDIEVQECIYLVDVYAKKEKTNLTSEEKKLLKKLVGLLKNEGGD